MNSYKILLLISCLFFSNLGSAKDEQEAKVKACANYTAVAMSFKACMKAIGNPNVTVAKIKTCANYTDYSPGNFQACMKAIEYPNATDANIKACADNTTAPSSFQACMKAIENPNITDAKIKTCAKHAGTSGNFQACIQNIAATPVAVTIPVELYRKCTTELEAVKKRDPRQATSIKMLQDQVNFISNSTENVGVVPAK